MRSPGREPREGVDSPMDNYSDGVSHNKAPTAPPDGKTPAWLAVDTPHKSAGREPRCASFVLLPPHGSRRTARLAWAGLDSDSRVPYPCMSRVTDTRPDYP